ncbi:MAG TPA: hypothetical protein EYP14_02545, partial [Planctomycetaceae bacterium]|nr:hypothetical protein [Planctomycetaceae bacterium]
MCPSVRPGVGEKGMRSPPKQILILVASLSVFAAGRARGESHSLLWGASGERWTPQSRLPDFSMAGYRRGEEPFRVPASKISVKSFGARGDGESDDTAAFQAAIRAGAGRVIFVPPGRYVLNSFLILSQSKTVLRGAGSSRTVLLFRTPGTVLDPRPARTDGGHPTSNWSWAGGLISIGGPKRRSDVAVRVAAEASRGDRELVLAKCPYRPGDEIVLILHDDERKSLLEYLYRGQPGNVSGLKRWRVRQVFRVRGTDGRRVRLDRPLRFDVRLKWRPVVERFTPSVTDVGVEGFRFEFPAAPYRGHFREVGYNPIEITATAAHCWLRDLVILNADSGPYVRGTFCTLLGIRLEADSSRLSAKGYAGHHGISLYANDCLVTDFAIQTRFIHDLTVQSAVGCVFACGRGVDLCFDHHRWAPYENLFTDIDAGRGS